MLVYEYTVHDGKALAKLRNDDFHRWQPTAYKQNRKGFLLSNADGVEVAQLTCGSLMRNRIEREIRRFLNLPDQPNYIKDDPQPFNGLPLSGLNIKTEEKKEVPPATKPHPVVPRITKFVAALSCYDNYISVFLPAAFAGRKFSCVYVDGKFLVSLDPMGVTAKPSTMERCLCTYSIKEYFPDMNFPKFNQFKLEVSMDEHGFEIPLMVAHQPTKSGGIKILSEGPLHVEVNHGGNETPREKAKRYISWPNDFCEKNDYTIKSENNRLVLERNDRID